MFLIFFLYNMFLQFIARHVLSNGSGETSYLLQLIEELCSQNDKLMDDARKEKEDLQQQVKLFIGFVRKMHRCMISDYSILVCKYSDEHCNVLYVGNDLS